MRGLTLTGLARQHGYSDSAVRLALRKPWPAVERIIAELLETTPQQLWPERYDAQGRSLHTRKRRGRA